MRPIVVASGPVAALATLMLPVSAAWTKPAPPGPGQADSTRESHSTAADTMHTQSRLGDLGQFQGIGSDPTGLVDNRDLVAAKSRSRDLELALDGREAGLQPRNATAWHRLDKDIDLAPSALRSVSPRQADCKAAMSNPMQAFDTLQGKI
jgi:hypothetical protein